MIKYRHVQEAGIRRQERKSRQKFPMDWGAAGDVMGKAEEMKKQRSLQGRRETIGQACLPRKFKPSRKER